MSRNKLARLISISILIQERLLRKEIISGISHLLEHTNETEMLRHTILACSYLSMNYNFSSSPLSKEIIEKLVPLVPIFKDKDLYVLLVTISKIMKGRDDNKDIFYNSTPNHLDNLLTEIIQNPKKKDLALAVSLILKEWFERVKIIEDIGSNENLSKLVARFLMLLANEICLVVDIPEKYCK